MPVAIVVAAVADRATTTDLEYSPDSVPGFHCANQPQGDHDPQRREKELERVTDRQRNGQRDGDL